jgi:hypothetical protein
VAGGSCRRTRPQTPQAPSEGRVPRHPPEERLRRVGHPRSRRGPRTSTSFAAAAPAPAWCAAALRRSIARPWSASALASQRCATALLGAAGGRGVARRAGRAALLLARERRTCRACGPRLRSQSSTHGCERDCSRVERVGGDPCARFSIRLVDADVHRLYTYSTPEPSPPGTRVVHQTAGNDTFQVTTVLWWRETAKSALSFTPESFARALKSTDRSSLTTVVRL